ncbi:MAG: MgtC/SapB family protein [Nocardioidaceae bacterium]
MTTPLLLPESVPALAALHGTGWTQVADLGLSLVLSALIGVERQVRHKSAGLRTHTLVGVGAALFMLISKFGFGDVLVAGVTRLDPSRVAAQIVTGIGFLGAGLIFVKRDSVRGLTTAAGVWVTAAIGSAAGADLPILACLGTAIYFLAAIGFLPLARRLATTAMTDGTMHIGYSTGPGTLAHVLSVITDAGFVVSSLAASEAPPEAPPGPRQVVLGVRGRGSLPELAAALQELGDVRAVSVEEYDADDE